MKKKYYIIWHCNGASWIYDTKICTEKEIKARIERYNANSSAPTYTYKEVK